MPMIDVYATGGTFANPKALARELASTLMKIEQVPDIPMFRKNTAAFIHDLPDGDLLGTRTPTWNSSMRRAPRSQSSSVRRAQADDQRLVARSRRHGTRRRFYTRVDVGRRGNVTGRAGPAGLRP